jgi:hypothetical protein
MMSDILKNEIIGKLKMSEPFTIDHSPKTNAPGETGAFF